MGIAMGKILRLGRPPAFIIHPVAHMVELADTLL